jgi:spore germination protein KC
VINIYKLIWKFFIFIIIIVLILAFSGSYNYFNIDNLAFVDAIAIDLADNDNLKVSFQFTKPTSVSDASSSDSQSTIINTVEAISITSAINLMNGYVGKELNLSHCKLIVFSEKIAINGVSDIVYTLMNNIQIRPSSNVVISKVDAKYYLESSDPSLENLSTKYYQIFPESSNYTGYLSNVTIGEFFNALVSKTSNPCAILGGITASDDNLSLYASTNPENSADIKSNETSISGERESENIGLAVFNGDKLVGELTAMDSICYSSINNDIDGFLITIPDPEDSEKYLDIYLFNNFKTTTKVDILNGTPYITINCKFSGKFYSITESSNYLDTEYLEAVSTASSEYMKTQISNYLYKTSKELKSDINGFGNSALSCFTTVGDFENYDWLGNYENAFFDVNVESNICSSFLLSETK